MKTYNIYSYNNIINHFQRHYIKKKNLQNIPNFESVFIILNKINK